MDEERGPSSHRAGPDPGTERGAKPIPYWKRPALRWGAILAALSAALALAANLSELMGWLAPDETLELVEETRSRVLDTDAKLDELLVLLRNQAAAAGEDQELDLEAEVAIRRAIRAIIDSGNRQKQEALELLATGDASGAARRLTLIAQAQASVVSETRDAAAESWHEAGALFYTLDIEAAVDAYREAQRLRPDDPQTLVELGYAEFRAGLLDEARRSLDRGIERAADPDTLAMAWLGLGKISRQRGDYDQAETELRQALSLVAREGTDWTRIFARNQLGMLLQARGRLTEAGELLGAAQTEAQAAGETRLEMLTLGGLGVLAAREGDLELAEAHLRQALAYHEANNDPVNQARALGNLGAVYLQQGDGDRAEPLLEQSVALGRRLGWRYSVAYDLVNLAAIDGEQGELESAERRLREAQSIAEETEMAELLPVIIFNRGDLAERAGDRESACRQWQTALPMMLAIGSVYAETAQQLIEESDCPAEP